MHSYLLVLGWVTLLVLLDYLILPTKIEFLAFLIFVPTLPTLRLSKKV